MPTRVVHVRKAPYDIYTGRKVRWAPDLIPIGWGNPYGPWNSKQPIYDFLHKHLKCRPDLIARLPELRGKTLACWCASALGLPPAKDTRHAICHAQILAYYADHPEELEELC